MPFSQFIKYLLLTILATVAGFYFLNLFIPLTQHLDLLGWSLACYILLAGIIYFLVQLSVTYQKGNGIIGLVMLNVLLKMVFTFGFVTIYVKLIEPSDRFFLVPVILTYLIFTVFETWFLNIQAREVK